MDHREASVAVIQFIEMLWELAHPSHDLSEATTAVLANPMDAEGTIPAVVIIGAVLQVRCRVCVCVCVCAMCVCTNGVCAQCVRAVASSTPTQMYPPYQLILSICSSFLPTSSSYRPVCHRSRTYRRSPPAGCIAWVRHGLQGDPGGGQQVHVAAPLDGIRTVSKHEVRIRRHPGTSTEVYEPVLSVYQ